MTGEIRRALIITGALCWTLSISLAVIITLDQLHERRRRRHLRAPGRAWSHIIHDTINSLDRAVLSDLQVQILSALNVPRTALEIHDEIPERLSTIAAELCELQRLGLVVLIHQASQRGAIRLQDAWHLTGAGLAALGTEVRDAA